ncbi:MAG: flagellar brake protein [Betaproteobacteria bacterium]|nr:flagellar brake protein [Betaproteobacteria bacterium]
MEKPIQDGMPEPDNVPQDLRISTQEVDGNYAKFEVTSEEEILIILRGLLRNGTRVTAYLNDSLDFLMTSLLAIDAESNKLTLALDSSKHLNRRAQLCSKLICISSQGKIKLQFELDGVDLVKFGEGTAFQGDIPASIIRLQRRDYYRLMVPKGSPLKCIIPVLQPDGRTVHHEANIVNISGRGLTMDVPHEGVELELDQEFPNCRIDLPGGEHIDTTLQIRSIYFSNLSGGRAVKRSGCQFLKMPTPVQKQLLRYILKVESERLAGKI